jgi:hypothetical protein
MLKKSKRDHPGYPIDKSLPKRQGWVSCPIKARRSEGA